MAEQRKSKLVYDGQTHSVSAEDGEKVIAAMTSSSLVGVELELGEGRSLWIVVGGGIPVSVMQDRREPREPRSIIL